jgi:hypothetical protein
VKKLLEKYPVHSAYVNCELQEYQSALSSANSVLLGEFVGNRKLIIFD